jgi:hypothetical protein
LFVVEFAASSFFSGILYDFGSFSLFFSKVQQSFLLCPCLPQTLHLPLKYFPAAKAVSGFFTFLN